MQIRDAHKDDLIELYHFTQSYFSNWPKQLLLEEILSDRSHFRLGWEYNERRRVLVGFCLLFSERSVLHIANILISKHFRRKGYAKQLIQDAQSIGEINKIRKIILEVRHSNTNAIIFYQNMGFFKTNHKRKYYTYPSEDAWVLTKQLHAPKSAQKKYAQSITFLKNKARTMEFIDQPAHFHSMLPHLHQASELAIDTESNRFHGYTPKICLLQIATRHNVYLIDPLALPKECMNEIKMLLEDPTCQKIMHAANNDLLDLQRDFGVQMNNLFDTFIAAKFLALPKQSLGALLSHYFEIQVNKKFQRYNWKERPLNEEALRYAALDVRYLLDIKEILSETLADLHLLEATQQESLLLLSRPYQEKPFNPKGYLKISGAKQLSTRQLALFRELYLWRHQTCLDLDQAAFMVLRDQDMLHLSRIQPKTLKKLHQTVRMKPSKVRHFGTKILDIIRQSNQDKKKTNHTDLDDKSMEEQDEKKDSANKKLFHALKEWRNQYAKQEEFAPGLVAPNSLLKEIAKQDPRSLNELKAVKDICPWRIERYGEKIIHALREFRMK